MIIINKGFLEGTIKWINSIKKNKADFAKYYKDKKAYSSLPFYLKKTQPAPKMPNRIPVSQVALEKVQDFIKFHKQKGLIDKKLYPLVNEILSESFRKTKIKKTKKVK